MDPQLLAGLIFLAGVIGVGVWMISRLEHRYHEERTRQAPQARSSPLLTIMLAVAIYGGLTWLTDYRTALTLALGGIAAAVLVQNVVQHFRNRT